MIDAMEIVETMCERYSSAVTANDSAAYRQLFCADAIRVPPGSEPERGPDEIARGEQADYDKARFTCNSHPIDALHLADNRVFGFAEAAVKTVAHGTGEIRSFRATKAWLLERQPSGDWLIKRQMWNLR
ncbi:YybH family protein [Defluviimonas salinarum]|uniref:DUF4440 domain-containing protein n=1 Tax=Defluviimonas salinarum TaxID=2992147 RepID=A0ABT3J837_9RHOB|nr:hypothetical protein [Defluviimonas salinarum]MCW3783839.1 hypothetical protein [Defluviimonas salinarum]